MKEPLFTWNNFKFLVREVIKMISNKDSYFSKKRAIEILSMTIFFHVWSALAVKMLGVDTDINTWLIWAAPLLAIGGYYLNATQKEKLTNTLKTDESKVQANASANL